MPQLTKARICGSISYIYVLEIYMFISCAYTCSTNMRLIMLAPGLPPERLKIFARKMFGGKSERIRTDTDTDAETD